MKIAAEKSTFFNSNGNVMNSESEGIKTAAGELRQEVAERLAILEGSAAGEKLVGR